MRGSAANANTASNVDAPKTMIKCYFVINATEATTSIALASGKFPMVCGHVVACLLSDDVSHRPKYTHSSLVCILQVNGIVRFVQFAQCAVHVVPKATTIRI